MRDVVHFDIYGRRRLCLGGTRLDSKFLIFVAVLIFILLLQTIISLFVQMLAMAWYVLFSLYSAAQHICVCSGITCPTCLLAVIA